MQIAVSGVSRVVVAALMVASAGTSVAQDAPAANPFEGEIRAFERADSLDMPEHGGVLFVGSSSIRMWESLENDFPHKPVIRRGFGGSQFSDLLHFIDRIVFPYAPRTILVYEGDNDIESGKTPAEVYGDYREFVGRVRERLPETRVAFIAIKPSIARWDRIGAIREANALIEAHAETDSLRSFIDVATPMLGADGTPRRELFLDDDLHLSRAGYALWREIVLPYLE